MAITDDQMDQLRTWAFELGRDGVLPDPSDGQIISAVFDRASIENMRTEDEFNEIISETDMPAPEDERDLIAEWHRGNTIYHRQGTGMVAIGIGDIVSGLSVEEAAQLDNDVLLHGFSAVMKEDGKWKRVDPAVIKQWKG